MSTTVVSTTVVARIEILLARPRDLVHLGLGRDQKLGERLEVHDPKDQPAKAQGKYRGNSQPPERSVVDRRFVDMPDSRGRDHSQAQGRIETGVPALHGLEKPGPPQVEEEHHECVRLATAGFPLGGFCRLRCRFDIFDFTHGTGLACLGGETAPKNARKICGSDGRLDHRGLRKLGLSANPGHETGSKIPGLALPQHERRESNPQPPVLETGALPIELRS